MEVREARGLSAIDDAGPYVMRMGSVWATTTTKKKPWARSRLESWPQWGGMLAQHDPHQAAHYSSTNQPAIPGPYSMPELHRRVQWIPSRPRHTQTWCGNNMVQRACPPPIPPSSPTCRGRGPRLCIGTDGVLALCEGCASPVRVAVEKGKGPTRSYQQLLLRRLKYLITQGMATQGGGGWCLTGWSRLTLQTVHLLARGLPSLRSPVTTGPVL
jgi:hypothetical protein